MLWEKGPHKHKHRQTYAREKHQCTDKKGRAKSPTTGNEVFEENISIKKWSNLMLPVEMNRDDAGSQVIVDVHLGPVADIQPLQALVNQELWLGGTCR